MTVLTNFSNGGSLKDYRDTFNAMLARLLALEGGEATVAPAPPPASTPPAGFALNGSTNPALKAMLARVSGNTGRGRIVMKGDSTTAGAGAGAGPGASDYFMVGARPNRPSAALAAQLAGAGYPALDNGFVGDNNAKGLATLPQYDARITLAGDWLVDANGGQTLNLWAGGNYIFSPTSGTLDFASGTSDDSWEIVTYGAGGTVTVTIDGAAPASLTASGGSVSGNTVTTPASGGFIRITARAASAGIRALRLAVNGGVILRGVNSYASASPAIDILNHAGCGATSTHQASTEPAVHWYNNDALGFDAPDLTIVNLGINDMLLPSPDVAAYSANLQAIVTKAREPVDARGPRDVLIVAPHPFAYSYAPLATQQAFRDAAAARAASAGVAFVSLFDYFGGAFTPALQARMADGLVHGNAGFYAEVGQVYRRCMQAMAA